MRSTRWRGGCWLLILLSRVRSLCSFRAGVEVAKVAVVVPDESKTSIRKVAAQEIYDLHGLQKLYRDAQRKDEAILRVYHVQNASWATHFLLRKFNVEHPNDLVGREFGKFVRRVTPERRGKRPFLTAKTWKVQHDPWRGLSKTCFGFDYLKNVAAGVDGARVQSGTEEKFMELNSFGEDGKYTTLCL